MTGTYYTQPASSFSQKQILLGCALGTGPESALQLHVLMHLSYFPGTGINASAF
jgi:hypothetical protein